MQEYVVDYMHKQSGSNTGYVSKATLWGSSSADFKQQLEAKHPGREIIIRGYKPKK